MENEPMEDQPIAGSLIEDAWSEGSIYERYMGRWSRLLARDFVTWLDIPAGGNWLDVGTGTGALVDAVCEHGKPKSILACDPVAAFVDVARRNITDDRVEFLQAGVGELPSRDGGFDMVISNVALNFFNDATEALREQASLLCAEGMVAASVWDYAGDMQFLRHFWDEAKTINPRAAKLDEGVRFSFCNPGALKELFSGAGLEKIRIFPIAVPTIFENFDDYWSPFLVGTGPAPRFVASLSEEDRILLADGLRSRLPVATDGRIDMVARAWVVVGCC